MAEEGEVRIKLVVDDLSKAIVDGMREGFAQMHQEVEGVSHEAGEAGLAGEVLKGNVYFELMQKSVELVGEAVHLAFEGMEHLVEASLEAADAVASQEKQMSRYLLTIDAGQHSMGELRSYTADMREEFEAFGLRANTSTEKLVNTFDELVQRGAMSSEKARDLTEQMAIVGKVVPTGIEGLASGFGMIESGMVRAKNPVVQLIAATATLQGNAKAVAEQMKKMSPEKQMKLGEAAIRKQAEIIKTAGGLGAPSLEELRGTFDGVKESVLEAMGKPMLDALIPHLVQLKDFLLDNLDEIKGFGERVGYEVAHFIDFFAETAGGIYQAVHENWDDVRVSFEELTAGFRAMWGSAGEDSHAIAHTFKDMTVDLIHAVRWVADTLAAVSEGLTSALKHVPGVGGLIREGEADNAEKHARMAGRGVGKEADAEFEKQVNLYQDAANAAGKSLPGIEATVQNMRAWHEEFRKEADAAAEATSHNDFAQTAAYIQKAVDSHNEGAVRYAMSLLEGSEEARKAFALGEVQIRGGFAELISTIGERSPELAAKLREAGNKIKDEGGVKAPKHQVVFNGAQINIKQDFRDQDPERVMITFKRDLGQSALSRVQSRMGGAFGL